MEYVVEPNKFKVYGGINVKLYKSNKKNSLDEKRSISESQKSFRVSDSLKRIKRIIGKNKYFCVINGSNFKHVSICRKINQEYKFILPEHDIEENVLISIYKIKNTKTDSFNSLSSDLKPVITNISFHYINDCDIKAASFSMLTSLETLTETYQIIKTLFDQNESFLETKDSLVNFENKFVWYIKYYINLKKYNNFILVLKNIPKDKIRKFIQKLRIYKYFIIADLFEEIKSYDEKFQNQNLNIRDLKKAKNSWNLLIRLHMLNNKSVSILKDNKIEIRFMLGILNFFGRIDSCKSFDHVKKQYTVYNTKYIQNYGFCVDFSKIESLCSFIDWEEFISSAVYIDIINQDFIDLENETIDKIIKGNIFLENRSKIYVPLNFDEDENLFILDEINNDKKLHKNDTVKDNIYKFIETECNNYQIDYCTRFPIVNKKSKSMKTLEKKPDDSKDTLLKYNKGTNFKNRKTLSLRIQKENDLTPEVPKSDVTLPDNFAPIPHEFSKSLKNLFDYKINDSFKVKTSSNETWSEIIDKNELKKYSENFIQLQEIVYELIYTEVKYIKTLKATYNIIYKGLITCVNLEESLVETMLPGIDKLIEYHKCLFYEILENRNVKNNNEIKNIGVVLKKMLKEDKSKSIIPIYSYLCANKKKITSIYNNLLENNMTFQFFISACMVNIDLQRLSIPDILQYITQRPTKYPLLIDRMLKYTTADEPDYEDLQSASILSKEFLKKLNIEIDEIYCREVIEIKL